MFENLDFSNLKLPVEPKHLLLMFLAYKLVNNIDKINLNQLGGNMPIPHPRPPQMNSGFLLFMFLMIVCSAIMVLNNILNRISFSSISVENLSANEARDSPDNLECNITRKCPVKRKCPMDYCPMFKNLHEQKKDRKCPMRLCPLFSNSENLKNDLMDKINRNDSGEKKEQKFE